MVKLIRVLNKYAHVLLVSILLICTVMYVKTNINMFRYIAVVTPYVLLVAVLVEPVFKR